MNTDKLIKLADELENNVSDADFAMSPWANCAMGVACRLFPNELKLIGKGHDSYIALQTDKKHYPFGGFYVTAHFFDITEEQAFRLFSALHYPNANKTSRLEVVARIREFVATNTTES